MAKKKPTDEKLKSASESQVSGMIARMFGVVPQDIMQPVFDQAADIHGYHLPVLQQEFHLYPWECPVPQFVMADKINTLVEDLAGSDGAPYVVRDSSATGAASLWVVRATFDDVPGNLPENLPVRALVNHFLIGDEWLRIIAFQLHTCLRKLKANSRQEQ